jgi:hypothetical protein
VKFNLPNDQKKQAYENVRNELEKKLILRLTIVGIDPESFDKNYFTPNPSSTAHMDIKDILEKIVEIEEKIKELE